MPAKIKSPTAEYFARALGLPRPSILTMMTLGLCKVPIDRIPEIASICGLPSLAFMQMALEEYGSEPRGCRMASG